MKRVLFVSACLFFLSLLGPVRDTQYANAGLTPTDHSSWFVDMNRFSASAHRNFACEKCHGDMGGQKHEHPDSGDAGLLEREATRIYDYARCRSCHRESYERYLRGAHARALSEELKRRGSGPSNVSNIQKAPTCGECHSAHYGKSHLSRVTTGKEMTRVCGACHPAQEKTYLENYHGKVAVHLGDEASAYCADCHGAHECVSLKDGKAALAACQRCHPQAREKFTQFIIHPTTEGVAKDNREKIEHVAVIKIVTVIMMIIVILVVGFFYGHSFLWLLRELHEKLRKH